MTNNPNERRIEFILDQQAQFAAGLSLLSADVKQLTADVRLLTADINLLKDSQNELTMNVYRLAEKVGTLTDIGGGAEKRISRVEEGFAMLVRVARITDGRLDDLSSKLAILAEAQATSDGKLATLADAQTLSEGRFDVLMAVLERYISGRNNGGKE